MKHTIRCALFFYERLGFMSNRESGRPMAAPTSTETVRLMRTNPCSLVGFVLY